MSSPLPLDGPIGALLPEGVSPGSTVAVSGSTALALALTAAVSGTDRWVAGIGWHTVGLTAAHELGIPWDRLVLVTAPGEPRQWATALSAAVEGFDVVVALTGTGQPGSGRQAGPRTRPVRSVDARRIRARTRERGTVLVVTDGATTPGAAWPARPAGAAGPGGRWWPEPAEVELRVAAGSWEGLGDGHGHLQGRRVTVEATGRGRLARPRRLDLWLPATDGAVRSRAGATPVHTDVDRFLRDGEPADDRAAS